MKVEDAFRGVTLVLLDTAPAIYYLEKNPQFGPAMERFFQLRARQGITLVTTPITLAECVMLPIQQGRQDLETAYHALIVTGQGTLFWTIGADEGVAAARLRAKHGLKLADAIQVAVGLASKCQVVLTNDADLKRVTELRVVLVSELDP